MKTSRFLLSLIFLLSFPIISLSQETLDVLYLKNGSIIKGTIIEQIPNETLKIQTKDGSIFVYNFSEVSKITREQATSDRETEVQTKSKVSIVTSTKSPGTAAVLSVLIPGLGNIYADKIGTGLWHMILISVNYAGYASDPIEYKWSLPVALLLHVWDIFDAYNNTIAYNDKLKKQHSINLIPLNDGFKLSFSMNF